MTQYFLQIFSMTDHAKAFDGRFQGPYTGLNADLQTAELRDHDLYLSNQTVSQEGILDREPFDTAKTVLCYRHSDTGELQGTSEILVPIQNLPWNQMPGIELKSVSKTEATLRLWMQDLTLKTGQVVRVHFMKTIVYVRFLGEFKELLWTGDTLTQGPSQLHAEPVDQDLTIAPPGASGLQVKMGQETTH